MSQENPVSVREKEIEFRELKADERANKAALIRANEESVKLRHNTFKHLTTLNTAFILLLVTFLEKLFSNQNLKFLVAIPLLLFILSTVISFVFMIVLSVYMRQTSFLTKSEEKTWMEGRSVMFSVLSFILFISGIICIALFALINLFL